MSVNKNDIDFLKVTSKVSDKKNTPKRTEDNSSTTPQKQDEEFLNITQSLKKKDGGVEPTKPSDTPPVGATAAPSPGTTNSIKWDDNPLNPVKAATDYEEKRDKTPEILFKDGDKQKLDGLVAKHNINPSSPEVKPISWIEDPAQKLVKPGIKSAMQMEYENASNTETALKNSIAELKAARAEKRQPESTLEKDLRNDLAEVQILKTKAATELVVNGDKEIEVNNTTNNYGNTFNKLVQDIFGSKPGAWQTEKPKIEISLKKQPSQFMTGMNMLKLTEPAEFERVAEAIANGLPVSSSQVAKITALGLNIEEAKLKRDILKSPVTQQEKAQYEAINQVLSDINPDIDKYEQMIKAKQPLSPEQINDYKEKINQYNSTLTNSKPLIDKVNSIEGAFAKKATALQEARRKNLVDNPEVLRAFIADGVANKLDEISKVSESANGISPQKTVFDFMVGHTWNYSDEQIKWASEQYLKEQGIDPNTPQVQAAIKFLQQNEGVMLGENSIAKASGFRELGEGLIEPIVGISKSIDDWTRPANEVYVESQSEGNVNAAKKRVESEDIGVRSVVNDVLKGTGQFVTQAALMYATSAGIGAVAEGIMGKSGVRLLADAKAANIKAIIPFDDATANIVGGKFLSGIKNPLAVFTTSYAMVYDNNLKAALSYTSDNALAKRAAFFNSSMEGATELFLSPLEIAQGILHKFSKNQTKDILKILSDKSLKDDPGALKGYVGKFVRGILGTAKVASAEIGEELVTQISDYVTNMYLNPNSDSFKSRNLKQELMTTAYQTGLSMAVPALLNGIGAAKANSFSKGSLLIAAQNRQKMVDDLNSSLAQGNISQEEANKQIQLINTAAEANAQVPKKANGATLNTDEKANYVWSLTTEAYMNKQMSSTADAAQKELWKSKIAKQQEYRQQILGLKEEKPEAPEYTIDDKPVSREEFLRAIEEKPDGNYLVTGDEEAQAALRKIGGIDDKTDSEVKSAVIEINGKQYEGKNHAEAILKAKEDGQDISKVDRKKDGKFKLADGTIIDRAEAKKRFGQDRSELLIEQDEAADKANKEYRKSDADLVKEVEDKAVPGYEKTSIEELKEQALQAPASFKNQFDDEELTVNLIAKNSEEQIKDAIKYQQERLNEPNIDDVGIEGIDRHIQLLEKGLELNKKFADEELLEKLPIINQATKPAAVAGKKEGKPLLKIEALKAKKLLEKETVPGETVDDKLQHIAENPEGFSSDIVALANKRFPKVQEESLTSVDEKEIKRQMKPITDEMANVEREYSNAGYEIDWDYDNEISITNKKTGELVVSPQEELPKNLVELGKKYEKATQQLADFDYESYHESLKESRKNIQGEEIQFEQVLNKEAENKAIEKWIDNSEYDDYISWDWDGNILEIFKSRDEAPIELTKEQLIEEGVDFTTKQSQPKGKKQSPQPNVVGEVTVYRGLRSGVNEEGGNEDKYLLKDKNGKEIWTNELGLKSENKPSEVKTETAEPRIKDVNLNKQIDLLSADFLDINTPPVTTGGSQRIKIVDIPISSINTDTASFQNRETEYSQESVDKIKKAVDEGRFNWTEFDPITLWKNESKLYVLSGHSRFEAFKQLAAAGNTEFENIPAEIFEGSKDDAITIALRSNTLSTKETPIERAGFYRDARLKGTSSRSILNEAKEYEGRNAPTIIALSYLNPAGKAISDLKALGQEGDTKSKANSLQMARWVGEVRQQFPQLTNEHENEIYDWLKAGAYSKIKNLAEISSRINNVVSGFDFDSDKPLNLEHRATKSYVDEQYEEQISEKEKQIKEQQKIISEKATRYNAAELTPQEVAEKLVPDNAILSRLQQDYIKLKDKKGSISQANAGILSLFDNIQTEIDNGNITRQEVDKFVDNTEQIEENDTVIEDIERNAESPNTASTAIEEGNELIAGKDVIAERLIKAENKLAEKVYTLQEEKRQRLNETTKPNINIQNMFVNDLFTMAATTEANRQEHNDIRDQMYSLKNLIDCLFS